MLGTKEQRTEGMKKQAQELIEQAYNRGYKAGYDKAFATLNENWQLVTSEAEEKGRNEAWEAAKKIMQMCVAEKDAIFATIGRATYSVILELSASEVIEKLKEYEEQKKHEEDEEIKVGDEVCIYGDMIGIVTYISETEGFSILWGDGSVGKRKNISDFKKTGRTFPEIAEVLKKMQEGE